MCEYTPIAEGRLDCVSELYLATRIKQKQFSNEERVCYAGNVAAKEKKEKAKKANHFTQSGGTWQLMKKKINCRKRNSTRDMLLRGWQQGQHFIIYAASLRLREEKTNDFVADEFRARCDILTIFMYRINFY
jgi:hypothetical protein